MFSKLSDKEFIAVGDRLLDNERETREAHRTARSEAEAFAAEYRKRFGTVEAPPTVEEKIFAMGPQEIWDAVKGGK